MIAAFGRALMLALARKAKDAYEASGYFFCGKCSSFGSFYQRWGHWFCKRCRFIVGGSAPPDFQVVIDRLAAAFDAQMRLGVHPTARGVEKKSRHRQGVAVKCSIFDSNHTASVKTLKAKIASLLMRIWVAF